MSDSEHSKFLISFAASYSMARDAKEGILAAADYIGELEGQVRLLNKLGNIDSSPGLVERVAALESRIQNVATQMDLEQFQMQMRTLIQQAKR